MRQRKSKKHWITSFCRCIKAELQVRRYIIKEIESPKLAEDAGFGLFTVDILNFYQDLFPHFEQNLLSGAETAIPFRQSAFRYDKIYLCLYQLILIGGRLRIYSFRL